MERVSAVPFYAQYYGHPISELHKIVSGLRQRSEGLVWLAGDSSADNKHWLYKSDKQSADTALAPFADALNGFEALLDPPRMVRDVAYWFNLSLSGSGFSCVNAALEESTIGCRRKGLTEQDQVICDCLRSSDIVVISVGGNDVALKPTPQTRQNMMQLILAPENSEPFKAALSYFVNMFKDQVEAYIKQLASKTTPRAVVVCMIYYLDETPGCGWAEGTLSQLGYNDNPGKLQSLIRTVYETATSKIQVAGINIVPFPLFKALDGKDATDYVARVEPSETGGKKIAEAVVPEILKALSADAAGPASEGAGCCIV